MPLPKGIYRDAEVRRAWTEERQMILAEFDRLVAGGSSPKEAARQLGRTTTSLRQMRSSLESLEGRPTGRLKGERIDLGLALLSVANPPGEHREQLTARDIAAWCDCSHQAIQMIETRALRKVRHQLNALLRGQVVRGEFAHALPALAAAA